MSRESLVGINAPAIIGNDWLNSESQNIDHLLNQDKIILIDFWTYSCINCIRTIPHLREWWEKYKSNGLIILGIHSPEFDFEKDPENIQKAMKDLDITWPVLNDSTHATWKAYNNHYWPRHLLINHTGKIVYDHIGEGSYEATEEAIQSLLSNEQSTTNLPKIISSQHQHKLGSVCHPVNPETYLGYERGILKNLNYNQDLSMDFTDLNNSHKPGVSLNGNWTVLKDYLSTTEKTQQADYLSLVFSAIDVNLVASSSNSTEIIVAVTLNDQPIPVNQRGQDIQELNGETILKIKTPQLYRVIKSDKYLSPAKLKLFPRSSNFQAYVFTFGGCTNID